MTEITGLLAFLALFTVIACWLYIMYKLVNKY